MKITLEIPIIFKESATEEEMLTIIEEALISSALQNHNRLLILSVS